MIPCVSVCVCVCACFYIAFSPLLGFLCPSLLAVCPCVFPVLSHHLLILCLVILALLSRLVPLPDSVVQCDSRYSNSALVDVARDLVSRFRTIKGCKCIVRSCIGFWSHDLPFSSLSSVICLFPLIKDFGVACDGLLRVPLSTRGVVNFLSCVTLVWSKHPSIRGSS